MRISCFRALFSGKKTCLHDFHLKQKGKMVEFAGKYTLIQATICPYSILQASSKNTSTAGQVPVYSMFPTWGRSSSQELIVSSYSNAPLWVRPKVNF